MQLIDRYLWAVERHLPRERRDDILAELRANILEMAEDREQELGRALTLDEEEEILKKHGHPMQVAARYLPKQYLIGPAVFPFYWYAIRVALPWVMLIYAIGSCARFISEPVSVQRIVDIVLGFFPVVFYLAGWMTLVFALMEYARENYIRNPNVLYAWKPRNLPQPELHPEIPEKKSNPIYDFIGSLFALLFLVVIRRHPAWLFGPAVLFQHGIRPADVWLTVYDIAMVLVSIQLAVKGMLVFSPDSRGWRNTVKLLGKGSGIIVIGFLLTVREYVVATSGADPNLVKAVDAINQAMLIGWRVVMVIVIAQLLWDVANIINPQLRLRLRKDLPRGFVIK